MMAARRERNKWHSPGIAKHDRRVGWCCSEFIECPFEDGCESLTWRGWECPTFIDVQSAFAFEVGGEVRACVLTSMDYANFDVDRE